MLERLEPVLKIICAILAALLLYQLGRLVAHRDPLARLTIPALPTLTPDTNAPASVNATNPPAALASVKSGTNALQSSAQATGAGTNAPANHPLVREATNITHRESAKAVTDPLASHQAGKVVTNSTPETGSVNTQTNLAPTGQTARSATNSPSDQVPGRRDTNTPLASSSAKPGTSPGSRSGMPKMGMNPLGGPGGVKLPELALPILARVDRITESEVLGPVIRPQPMALLGIAGNVAFLRAPNGQTGLVKEGDELSGLKLLRIGTNRVLVEQDGQKTELTIFSGYGGESLMPKQKDTSP